MAEATITGLLPTVTLTLKKNRKRPKPRLDFQTCVKPAILEVKPFGTYFNPFNGGCSILCNHPIESDFKPYFSPTRNNARKVMKRKDDKKAAARQRSDRLVEKMGRLVGGMLERMGATDHTLRKCLTPGGNRPTLVLDLRRTHSSDNLPSSSQAGGRECKQSATSLASGATISSVQTLSRTPLPPTKEELEEANETKDDEIPRRRGKKVKKKKKSQEKTPRQPSVGMLEPNETQISTYIEGLNKAEEDKREHDDEDGSKSLDPDNRPLQCSIFDLATLRHLRRNMTKMDTQSEYSKVWRRVLNEAVRGREDSIEDTSNSNDMHKTDPDQWINLPRLFSLASARFQLPLDRNTLNYMESLEYLREHVFVAKGKKMLYNHVFIKYSIKQEDGVLPTEIPSKILWEALGEVVGGGLDQSKRDKLWQYVDWNEEEGTIDLLTWYGLCAFTERILGKENDGRSQVEEADFELLPRILSTVQPTDKLVELLKAIHSIGESTSVTTSPDLWKNLVHLQITHAASLSLDETSAE